MCKACKQLFKKVHCIFVFVNLPGFLVFISLISLLPTHSSGLIESENNLHVKYSGSSNPKTSKKNPQRRIVSIHNARHGGTGFPIELHLGTNREHKNNGTSS